MSAWTPKRTYFVVAAEAQHRLQCGQLVLAQAASERCPQSLGAHHPINHRAATATHGHHVAAVAGELQRQHLVRGVGLARRKGLTAQGRGAEAVATLAKGWRQAWIVGSCRATVGAQDMAKSGKL